MTTEEREAIKESVQKAADSGLFLSTEIKSPTKLKPNSPKIAICVPMGDKDDPDLFHCQECGYHHWGTIKCPLCEKEFHWGSEFQITCGKCGHEVNQRDRLRHAGLAPIEWLANAWQLVSPLLCSMQLLVRKSELSAQARNEMTFEAVNSGAKYIFYWDDDTIIPPKTIYDMHRIMELHPEAAIVTGVYTTRERMNEPILYKEQGQGAYWNFSVEPGVIEPIWAAGAGCMMARVEALEDVEKILGGPWWFDEHDPATIDGSEDARVFWGHDIRFCKRVHDISDHPEARQKWQVYLAGWIQCFHFDVAQQTMYSMPKESPCFKNKNAPSYWDSHWSELGYVYTHPNLFDRIAELIPENSHVVDLGCGEGGLLDFLVKTRRVYPYGIDQSKRGVAMMNAHHIPGEVSDLKDFSLNHFPPEETIVTCTETMEHLEDETLEHLLKESSRAKMFIVTVPDGTFNPRGDHLREFTQESLSELLMKYWVNVSVEKIVNTTLNSPHLVAFCSGSKEMEVEQLAPPLASPGSKEMEVSNVSGSGLVSVSDDNALANSDSSV